MTIALQMSPPMWLHVIQTHLDITQAAIKHLKQLESLMVYCKYYNRLSSFLSSEFVAALLEQQISTSSCSVAWVPQFRAFLDP